MIYHDDVSYGELLLQIYRRLVNSSKAAVLSLQETLAGSVATDARGCVIFTRQAGISADRG